MKSCSVKKSVFVFLFGFFFLLACGAGFSQNREKGERPEPPSAGQIVSRMKQDLNLTEEQVRQVTPVIQDEIARTRGIMTQTKDREQAREQSRALRKDTEAKLSQYLTEEQMAGWRNIQQNRFRGKNSAMCSREDEEESGQTGKKKRGGNR